MLSLSTIANAVPIGFEYATSTITDKQALNIFKKALGNRANLLDANKKSGTEGALAFFKTNATIKNDILTTKESITRSVPDLFDPKADQLEVLTWFRNKMTDVKTSFTVNQAAGLNQAGNAKVLDLCSVKFITKAKEPLESDYLLSTTNNPLAMTKDRRLAYKDELAKLSKTRKNTITSIIANYNTCVNDLSPSIRSIRSDICTIKKNLDINTAWTTYYGEKGTAISSATGAVAIYDKYYGNADAIFTSCKDGYKWEI